MRCLFVFLFFSSGLFAQNLDVREVLIMGNYNSICLADSGFVKTDTLPEILNKYDAVMLFSSSTSNLSSMDVERLTDYVEEGGGLYAGSENWPFQSESNQITRRLYKKESYGNFEHKNAESVSAGNLQLEDIETIPAGTSTVAFPMDYRLQVEAWVEDQPLILTGTLGKGRIVIDGGYSRFYCDSKNEESEIMLEKILDFLKGN